MGRFARFSVVAIAAGICACSFGQVSFRSIVPIVPGAVGGDLYGLSPDGKLVVGRVQFAGEGYEAFRWSQTDGTVLLGTLSTFWLDSYARATSGDGSVVVGYSFGWSGPEAFRWTEQDGMVGLGDLPGGGFESLALDVSADGSIIVGYGYDAGGRQPVKWTSQGGMERLPLLPGFDGGIARSISADGTAIVGEMYSASLRQAVLWRDGVAVSLGSPAGLDGGSYATDASWNGSVIVGKAGLPCGPGGTCDGYVFRWSEATGMITTGMGVPADAPVSVSGDGTFIVSRGTQHPGAVIWPSIGGLCDVREVLTKYYGLNLDDFPVLTVATAISADGRTIAGNSPSGMWLAHLDYTDVAGDTNRDRCVDDTDLTNVLLDYGVFPGRVHGQTDMDCTGTVDDADITIVILNYAQGC